MLIVRATKKLRQRLGSAVPHEGEPSTTLLGEWYATALPWQPQQLILLVNERTLLPVLMPLAPSATVPSRIGPEIAGTLAAHRSCGGDRRPIEPDVGVPVRSHRQPQRRRHHERVLLPG